MIITKYYIPKIFTKNLISFDSGKDSRTLEICTEKLMIGYIINFSVQISKVRESFPLSNEIKLLVIISIFFMFVC